MGRSLNYYNKTLTYVYCKNADDLNIFKSGELGCLKTKFGMFLLNSSLFVIDTFVMVFIVNLSHLWYNIMIFTVFRHENRKIEVADKRNCPIFSVILFKLIYFFNMFS